MFMHMFGYRLKCLARDRELVFWTLIFPLILATMFHFAFDQLMGRQEAFSPIGVAVVASDSYQQNITFRQALGAISEPGESQLIELTVTDEREAFRLLEDGAVAGVITVGDSVGLTVSQSGIEQSILKAVLDEYAHRYATVTGILRANPAVAGGLIRELRQTRSYTQQISFSSAEPDTTLNFFYALIAMTCLYGGFWGLRNTTDMQADLSPQGARRSAAPTHKLGVVLYDLAAALTISLAEVMVLLAYLMLVLRVSFGNEVWYVLLTSLVGCIAGVSLGAFIGTYVRKSEGAKTGILIGTSMTMSLLAGLMIDTMKDMIARKAPVLSYINPAALITDAFYSLYIFESHRRFFLNIGLLLLISSSMCILSFLRLRRDRYASL
jgi:ABC-2 type transport system permease protein